MKILKVLFFAGWLAFVYHIFNSYMDMIYATSSPEHAHDLFSQLGIFMFGDVLITLYLIDHFWVRKEKTKA